MTLDIANSRALIKGYGQMVEERVATGWQPTLLTFKFNQLSGSPNRVAWLMKDEVERVYAIVLPRVIRKHDKVSEYRLPFWICAPDYPVFKRDKDNFRDISINDGLHIHAVALTPPWSRKNLILDDHFYHEQGKYAGQDC